MDDTTATQAPEIPSVEHFYFFSFILCFTFGSVCNMFALRYFIKQRTTTLASTLYFLISVVDLVACSQGILFGMSFRSTSYTRWMTNDVILCNIWGVVWYLTPNYTIILTTILSVTRSWILAFPLRKCLDVKTMLIIVGCCASVYFIQALIPIWKSNEGSKYLYYNNLNACTWPAGTVFEGSARKFYEILYTSEQIIPIFPILVSCVYTSIQLKLRKNWRLAETRRLNRGASITIILFTSLYILLNTPKVFAYIYIVTVKYSLKFDAKYHYFYFFYEQLSCLVNSTLNPVLYFWRMTNFRNSIINLFRVNRPSVRVKFHK